MIKLFVTGLLIFLSANTLLAQDKIKLSQSMQLEKDTRAWFRNPDGSCVQCSIGMCGVHCNDLNAASLLWDSEFGPAERKGSWPSRVTNYCNSRGIKAWNITGDTTIEWMKWAAKTGRFAAIGLGRAHFQTLYGYDPNSPKPWKVCNNNSTSVIDEYTEEEFKRLHYASGTWVVILEKPSSKIPQVVNWWD